MKSLTLLT